MRGLGVGVAFASDAASAGGLKASPTVRAPAAPRHLEKAAVLRLVVTAAQNRGEYPLAGSLAWPEPF
jgi:hypothetical protein